MAQEGWITETPDSLASIILDFEELSFKQINSKKLLKNEDIPNVLTYEEKGDIKIAYYTTDRNKWNAVTIPFTMQPTDFRLINIDQLGSSELVVKGRISEYGTGGGIEYLFMTVLSLGKVPKQIFKIIYGYEDEYFGNKKNGGSCSYLHTFIRKVVVTNQGISISPIPTRAEGIITLIPSGFYRLRNEKFVKRN